VESIKDYYAEFISQLDERMVIARKNGNFLVIEDVEVINQIRDDIIKQAGDILSEEYALLDQRIDVLEQKKAQYFSSLLVGIIIGTILLLLLNTFLLRAQKKRSDAEESLDESQQRFVLAVEGTQEGIFDWDLKTGQVYYSRRFYGMLGYDDKSSMGSVDDFTDLLHPDDLKNVWENVNLYLEGETKEYIQEFRMRHKDGRYMWIQARATALFNEKGRAYRMVGTHTDVTPMMKAQEKLVVEKEQAEQANQAKSDFLAHMSHEIRTPLTAISGIAEILNRQKDSFNDKQRHLLRTLSTSTASLKDLINDILDFSKIENGDIELEESVFPLNKLFANVISIMSVKAAEKNIEFQVNIEDVEHCDFKADQMRMRQILINLLGNAMKFTEKGSVTINASIVKDSGQNYLSVAIEDTGIGIDKDKFTTVFERFRQADASVSRQYGGTGLGLPISKNLASVMGGDLTIESELGQGSIFTLLLPFKINVSTRKTETGLVSTCSDSLNVEGVSNTHKVLLVEDYEGNIVVLSYILEEMGIDYDVARNGIEALDHWSKNTYDVILMDVQMPLMDGFQATSKIREAELADNNGVHVPIIGMTAHALVGDKDKCIEAGMDAYLPKPIVENDLKTEILKYLNRKKS